MLNSHTPLRATGFPSPGDDFFERSLSLDEYLISRASSTFFMRAKGNSMFPTIQPGAILVIDRSLKATKNSLIVIFFDGELIVRRLIVYGSQILLRADNKNYPDKTIPSESDFEIWGIITSIIHKVR